MCRKIRVDRLYFKFIELEPNRFIICLYSIIYNIYIIKYIN